eukprot:2275788-Ditylum_brightwellii.AAC.1
MHRTAQAFLTFCGIGGPHAMLGHEASMVLKQLSIKLAAKWECPPSKAANYIKTTMSLSLVRATHHFLCRSHVPSSLMSTHQWPCKDGASIGFLQTYVD